MNETMNLTPRMMGGRELHFIGLGSLGSGIFQNFFRMLAPRWKGKMTLWDADTVEERNRFNQKVFASDVNRKKVAAMARIAQEINPRTDIELVQMPARVTEKTKLSGIVVSAVDSFCERKKIWQALRHNSHIAFYVDSRMGMTGGCVYGLDPNNEGHIVTYEEPDRLPDDPPEANPACKTEFPHPCIADIVGGHAAARVVERLELEEGSPNPYMNYYLFDFKHRFERNVGFFSTGEYWDDPVPSE